MPQQVIEYFLICVLVAILRIIVLLNKYDGLNISMFWSLSAWLTAVSAFHNQLWWLVAACLLHISSKVQTSKHPFRDQCFIWQMLHPFFSIVFDKYRNKICPVTNYQPPEAQWWLGWFAIKPPQTKNERENTWNTVVRVNVSSHFYNTSWAGGLYRETSGMEDWECGIPLLIGSVDFWLSVSQRCGAGQAFQPCGYKEALSTAVILWRRSGNATGLLLHTGLQDPH